MIDFEKANNRRDKRLRRRIIQILHLTRHESPMGEMRGRRLADVMEEGIEPAERLEDDDHLMGLLQDLANKGYVDLRDARRYKQERYGLDYLVCRITAEGSSLWLETRPPDPDVEDERIGAEG